MGFEQHEQEKLRQFQARESTIVQLMQSYSEEDLKIYYAEREQADINDTIYLLEKKYPALRLALSYKKGGYGPDWFERNDNIYDLSESVETEVMVNAMNSFKFGIVTSDGKFYNAKFYGHYNLVKWLEVNHINIDNAVAVSTEDRTEFSKGYGLSDKQISLLLYSPFDYKISEVEKSPEEYYINLSRKQVRALDNLARYHDASIEEAMFSSRRFGLLHDGLQKSHLREKVGRSNLAIMSEVLREKLDMFLMRKISEVLNEDTCRRKRK